MPNIHYRNVSKTGLSAEIEKYREQMVPAIILIPGVKGNTGHGVKGVKDCVEQAIGSDIVFGKE